MASELHVGTMFGEWRVEAYLGTSCLGSTYLVRRFGARNVLRILGPTHAKGARVRERFLALKEVSERVAHAAVIQVHETGEWRGDLFARFERVEGTTLENARNDGPEWSRQGVPSIGLRRTAMAAERALGWMAEALDCVASGHEHGVLHRDLRLETLFVAESGSVKIGNYGVAQVVDATDERSAIGTTLGSPAFMAPEQAMGLTDQLDARADLFSIGAILYALVTGGRLHARKSEQEALVAAATTPVGRVSELGHRLPEGVLDLIDKALQWDRRKRYGSAREMKAAALDVRATLVGDR